MWSGIVPPGVVPTERPLVIWGLISRVFFPASSVYEGEQSFATPNVPFWILILSYLLRNIRLRKNF